MVTKKKAHGYVRVSTMKQVEEKKTSSEKKDEWVDEKSSPEKQEKAIVNYCESNNLHLVKVHKDLGISGIKERPGLMSALREAKQGRYNSLVIYDLTRFGRSTRDILKNYYELQDAKVELKSVKEGVEFSTPIGKVVLSVMASLAEIERIAILERTTLAKLDNAKKGKKFGPAPFGRTWNEAGSKLLLIPEKKEMIETAADLFLKENMPLDTIAKVIGMDRNNLRYVLNNSCGDKWHIEFDVKEVGIKDSATIKMDRLLDQKTIEKVKAKIAKNRERFHGKRKYNYLLSELCRCSHCNARLSGATITKGNYKIYKHKDKGCVFRSIRADKLEEVVIKKLHTLYKRVEDRIEAIEKANTTTKEADRLEKELTIHQKQVSTIDTRIERLLNQVEQGNIEEDEIGPRMAKHRADKEAVLKEIEGIKDKLEQALSTKEVKRRAKIIAYWNWNELWPFDKKQQLIRDLVSSISIGKKKSVWNIKLNGVFGIHEYNLKSQGCFR